MIKSRLKVRLVLIAMALLLCSLGTSCAPSQDFDKQLRTIIKPYRFSLARWEFSALGEEVRKAFCDQQRMPDDGIGEVTEYFSNVEQSRRLESEIEAIKTGNKQGNLASLEAELSRLQQQNTAVADTIEKLLETRIREALSQQGIFNPIDKYTGFKFGFPPVNFKIERPPHILVVSPRDRIDSMREAVLLPDMSLEDMESVEDKIDRLFNGVHKGVD